MMDAVQLVGVLILLLLISLLSLYGYILVANRRSKKIARQFTMYYQYQEQAWHRYLLEDAPLTSAMIPQQEGEYRAIEKIASTYLRLVKDPVIKKRITLFAEQYLADRYEKQLHSKAWSVRLNALNYIGILGVTSLLPHIFVLLQQNTTKEERFEMLQVIALYEQEAAVEIIKDQTFLLTSSEYKQLFYLLNNKALHQLLKELDILDHKGQATLIDVVAQRRDAQFLPYVNYLLQHDNSELRIGGLKLLYEMHALPSINQLEPFIISTSYVERLYATKNLGQLPLSVAQPYLLVLLEDKNWYVRHQAARTMATYDQGLFYLQQFITESNDAYAIDVAKQILQESGVQQ